MGELQESEILYGNAGVGVFSNGSLSNSITDMKFGYLTCRERGPGETLAGLARHFVPNNQFST